MSIMFAVCPDTGTNASVVVATAPESTANFAYSVVVAPTATRSVVVDRVILPILLVVHPPADETPCCDTVPHAMSPEPLVWSALPPEQEVAPA